MATMFKKAALAAVTTLSLGLAGTANAAPATSDSDTAQVRATITRGVSVTKLADMDFGTIITDGTAGTVTLANNGAITCNAAILACAATGTAASFEVKAFKNTLMALSMTKVNPVLTTGEALPLTVSGFSANGTTDNTGKLNVTYAGSLAVGTDQVPGNYVGSVTLTASYQ